MNIRIVLVGLHDVAVAAIAWILAYWLRFNFEIPPIYQHYLWMTVGPVVVVQAIIFWRFGLYRGIWHFASIPDLRRIIIASGISSLAVPMVLFMLQIHQDVPRSVLVLDPLFLVVFMGGSRFLYRSWKDGHLISIRALEGQPVIILGAGEMAAKLLREINSDANWRVIGLLDDDGEKRGRMIAGYKVLGRIEELPECAARFDVQHVIVAMPESTSAKRRQAVEVAGQAGLKVLTVPALSDLLSGQVTVSQIREVGLEDLLGRDPIQLDDEGLHRLLTDKVVAVTGAGGSIGSELCRQIARFRPRLLIFYELSELALYKMEQEFADQAVECVIGDVKDSARLAAVFGQYRPDVVFHAAAYKHVPMMENANAWEAIRNNVLGTYRVAQAAIDHQVSEFVLISTDKAVNPTNVMGASKRLAEMVCQSMQSQAPATRFVTVRFGNVLGSSGSVIPKFREQIARGGPVTVTHPDIIRYFMLIPEAAQLVLQAGLMGKGGEIFVLDMGAPVKIVDLARDMIRLSGFSEDDIRIEFTGLRPGEKLYEELLADGEATLATPHPKLRVAKAAVAPDMTWLAELQPWLAAPVCAEADVKAELAKRVPEYRPAQH